MKGVKKHIIWVVVGGLLLLIGIMIGRLGSQVDDISSHTKQDDISAKNSNSAVMTVNALRPEYRPLDEYVSASGTITGRDEATVGTRISGVAVEQVMVKEGDYVKAGQTLAKLDDHTSAQNILSANANLQKAKAALAKATSDLSRVEPLIQIDAISREQYDGYRTAKTQAQLDVQAATAEVNLAKNAQNNSLVVAPISGIISEKAAEVGMVVTGAPLFTIIKDGVLEWQANVPADKANELTAGQSATLDRPKAGRPITGVIDRISPTANDNRELTVHVTLPKDNRLTAGMFVSGKFAASQKTLLAIPARLVSTQDGYDYVWVLEHKADDFYTAHKTRINISSRSGIYVATNLDANTLLIAQGGNFLRDGDTVRVVGVLSQSAETSAIDAGL
ncbi:efflux RND transporter periplasmic adaptor subunit [Moraxella nasovis]|uniref:efflux RND transporter periplasmic adaptor subunit n=1 Tax=Moraxella nasovis TaxID=2904121 RepID=UPI001F61A88F|nr:efflux RND transporter periplasmic adaptor subunit [Moraxella nasovis]UNU72869.1 efflux RND transporter periplasmic adaptor subunit [Moraxella nasovis]